MDLNLNLVQSLVCRFGCGWRSADLGMAAERREAMKERYGLSDGRAAGTWVVVRRRWAGGSESRQTKWKLLLSCAPIL